jgi:hypothetical protein
LGMQRQRSRLSSFISLQMWSRSTSASPRMAFWKALMGGPAVQDKGPQHLGVPSQARHPFTFMFMSMSGSTLPSGQRNQLKACGCLSCTGIGHLLCVCAVGDRGQVSDGVLHCHSAQWGTSLLRHCRVLQGQATKSLTTRRTLPKLL